MSAKAKTGIRVFNNFGEAYYHKSIGFSGDNTGEVSLGLQSTEGGTVGEFTMVWKPLGGKSVPQLRVFDDGWAVLASWIDLLAELAKLDTSMSKNSITPKEFCDILIGLGFKDNTQRVDPLPAGTKNHTPSRDDLENALKNITSLWPDPGMCAELAPKYVGQNDGRMRADKLWYALNEARKGLGLPTYTEPAHWNVKECKEGETE